MIDESSSDFTKGTASLTASANCQASVSSSVEANLDVRAGDFVFDADVSWWRARVNSIRVGYNPSITATVTAQAAASLTCNANLDVPELELPTITFTIGPVPVWITQTLDTDLNASFTAAAAGSRTLQATASAWFGMSYNRDNGWTPERSFSVDASDTSTTDVGIDIVIALPVTYSARLYGFVGLDGTIEPGLRLAYTPLEDKYLALYGKVAAEIAAELDLGVLGNFSHAFIRIDVIPERELWSKTTQQEFPFFGFCPVRTPRTLARSYRPQRGRRRRL